MDQLPKTEDNLILAPDSEIMLPKPDTHTLSSTESSLPPLPTPDQTTQNNVSFESPQDWGQQSQPSVTTDQPIASIPQIPQTNDLRSTISSPEPESSPSFLKITLISLALILLGILLGVLAAKFFQPAVNTPVTPPTEVTPMVTDLIVTPVSTSSASPSAGWKTYSDKNNNFSFQYPEEWTVIKANEEAKKYNTLLVIVKPTDVNTTINSITEQRSDAVFTASPSSIWLKSEIYSQVFPQQRDAVVPISKSETLEITAFTEDMGQLDQILSTFKFPNPSSKASPSMCGGFAGLLCPSGYSCVMKDSYPDASGTCIAN